MIARCLLDRVNGVLVSKSVIVCRVVQKETAQSLQHHNFATVRYRVFQQNVQKKTVYITKPVSEYSVCFSAGK